MTDNKKPLNSQKVNLPSDKIGILGLKEIGFSL